MNEGAEGSATDGVSPGGLLTPNDAEGKFEVLLQDYRFSVSFLGPQTARLREQHITKACPAGHALSSRATTLLLMITPRHPLHAHAHSTRTLARVRVARRS